MSDAGTFSDATTGSFLAAPRKAVEFAFSAEMPGNAIAMRSALARTKRTAQAIGAERVEGGRMLMIA